MTTTKRASVGFWIIAIIALIWNAMGVMSYLMAQYKVESYRAGYNEEQLALMDSAPAWSTALFAIAVFGGFLGCFFLLMRKKLATPLFLISLICILINIGYGLFGTNQAEVFGTMNGIIMPLIVVVIGVYLYFFSKRTAANGILK
jgi:hypothetical protein